MTIQTLLKLSTGNDRVQRSKKKKKKDKYRKPFILKVYVKLRLGYKRGKKRGEVYL